MSKSTFSLCNLDNSSYNTVDRSTRYIPSRKNIEFKKIMSHQEIKKTSINDLDQIEDQKQNNENIFYKDILLKNLKKDNKVFKSMNELALDQNYLNNFNTIKSSKFRKIDNDPFKILDAPLLQDDYYLNVVDWSVTNNLAVGLANTAYVWNFQTNEVHKIIELEEENFVSCLNWDKKGKNLVIGNIEGTVKVFDFVKNKEVNCYDNHLERVGAISLFDNLLITGSRDSFIYLYDLRLKNQPIKTFSHHNQEVCGLKWSPTGRYFASGGNDNKLHVFSIKTDFPLYKKTHRAAVKAIAWSENSINLLASGAGSADRCLRIFNTDKNKVIYCKDTGSQICNLKFSKRKEEIITSHGFSTNDVVVWKVKNLQKICSFSGHSSRVLYMSISPDGNSIVTGAGDETLRFWNLNYKSEKKSGKSINFLNFTNPIQLR